MLPRARWLVCLACLGCHVAPNTAPPTESLPPLRKSHLSLAAAALADGDDEQACDHLSRFVQTQPEHRNARFFLAELLLQRGQHAAARAHYEQTIAACQAGEHADLRHLLHCHGRLLAIAEALDDEYEIELHKGIGLVLLAQARGQLGDPAGELPVEALLCRAAGCLAAAHALRPEEARPCWYLHVVWRQLGQTQPSQRWLSEAHAAAPFSSLTPAEQHSLALADHAAESKHRP